MLRFILALVALGFLIGSARLAQTPLTERHRSIEHMTTAFSSNLWQHTLRDPAGLTSTRKLTAQRADAENLAPAVLIYWVFILTGSVIAVLWVRMHISRSL